MTVSIHQVLNMKEVFLNVSLERTDNGNQVLPHLNLQFYQVVIFYSDMTVSDATY